MMDVLKGFPHVFFTNLESRTIRKKYMENQLIKWKIPYTPVVMEEGLPQFVLDKVLDIPHDETCKRGISYNTYILETMREWYQSTNDPYMIIMEDDFDLSLISKWHFTWEEFIARLPYDWDCIQLGFECPDILRFYLHPTQPNYSLGPTLVNRHHVEKLLDIFTKNGKYDYDLPLANHLYMERMSSGVLDGVEGNLLGLAGCPDYWLAQAGNSYSIPLIPSCPYFVGETHLGRQGEWFPMLSFIFCYEAYHEWWNNDKHNFTLDEFFTFGKDNDILMERNMTRWDNKYFTELTLNKRKLFLKDYE